jgi:hypothetical protein
MKREEREDFVQMLLGEGAVADRKIFAGLIWQGFSVETLRMAFDANINLEGCFHIVSDGGLLGSAKAESHPLYNIVRLPDKVSLATAEFLIGIPGFLPQDAEKLMLLQRGLAQKGETGRLIATAVKAFREAHCPEQAAA